MKFFTKHKLKTTFIPTIDNKNDFQSTLSNLLNQGTSAESQSESRISKINESISNNAIKHVLPQTKKSDTSKWKDNLIIHHIYESRLAPYKKEIHRIWKSLFSNSSVMNTRLIIGNRNNQNATRILAHRNPHYKSKKASNPNYQQN